MTIIKSENQIETYRAKARSADINELTGRSGRPDLTAFVMEQIVAQLPLKEDAVLVDIGCGNGLLLQQAADRGVNGYRGRLIGILPTREEVTRVREYLLAARKPDPTLISVELGLADRTGLPASFADVIVCNSVLHGAGQTLANTRTALAEFARVAKTGATLFIGEIPDIDERAAADYGDSILRWLLFVWKNRGFGAFLRRLRQVLVALFSQEPFVIVPKHMFHMKPEEFSRLLEEYGFKVLQHHRHKEISADGRLIESPTRWDFLAIKG